MERKINAKNALARSLYGEMGVCAKTDQGEEIYKATARTLINRSFALVQKQAPVQKFIDPTTNLSGQKVIDLIPGVSKSEEQISSWNQNDINLIKNICPPNIDDADQDDLNPEEKAWAKALKVAEDIIDNPKKFLQETKDIHQSFYSSNFPGLIPDWTKVKKGDKTSGMVAVNDFIVGGKKVHGGDCLTLWTDKVVAPQNKNSASELIDKFASSNKPKSETSIRF